jgi:hypothetical protein
MKKSREDGKKGKEGKPALRKQTIRKLTTDDLEKVAGGFTDSPPTTFTPPISKKVE